MMSDPVIVKLYSGEAIICKWPEKSTNKDPYGLEKAGREIVKPLGVQYRIEQPAGRMRQTLVSWSAERMFIYDDAIMGIGPAPDALAKAYIQALTGIKIVQPSTKVPSTALPG